MPFTSREARREYVRQYNARWRRANPETARRIKLKARLKNEFGLSIEQFDAMLAAQNGVCAICKRPDPTRQLSVDHDHKTGRVRQLLCNRCNPALGYVQDDVEILKSMIVYLERHKCSH